MVRYGLIVGSLLSLLLVAGAAVAWSEGWFVSVFGSAPAQDGLRSDEGAETKADPLTAIEDAIRRHDAVTVERFLAEGFDPDQIDSDGEILLNKAVLTGTPEIVDILLKAGADPDAPGKNGLGPLAVAALAGQHEMLERLIEASALHQASSLALSAAPQFRYAPPQAAAVVAEASARAARNAATDASAAPATLEATASAGLNAGPLAIAPGVRAPIVNDEGVARAAPAADAIEPVPPKLRATETRSPAVRPRSPSRAAISTPPTAAPVDTPTPAAAPAVSGDATSGSIPPTPWVLAAQQRLSELGYYEGPVDGIAGPQTANAIVEYQSVAGLPQDGLISQDLLSRIGARIEPAQIPRAVATAPAAERPRGASRPQAAGDDRSGGQDDQAAVQAELDRNRDSAARAAAMLAHCQRNANALVYDAATKRPVSCQDVIASATR